MMKAARFFGKRDIRVESVPRPQQDPGKVLVAIEWAGICGSDLHEYIMGPGVVPTEGNPHPITKEVLPVTFGHEFCGRVLEAPAGSKLKKGDAVMVDPRLYCRSCNFCEAGITNGCAKWGFRGLSGSGGGFSEAVSVEEDVCHYLPESVPLEYSALIEPLTVATHALHVSGIKDFDKQTVLVVGGGPVGFAVCMALRANGANKVFVSEPTKKRKEQITEHCDAVFNPIKQDVGEECRKLTAGNGVDIVFDCAGIQPGLETGMDALKFEGLYVNVAGWEKPMMIPAKDFMLKQITVKASMSYTNDDFRETVELFTAGKYKGFEKMVTSRIALDDIVAQGFEELINNKDSHIKVLITPRSELLNNGAT